MCPFLNFRALGQDELTLDNSTSHQHVALLLKESSLSAQPLLSDKNVVLQQTRTSKRVPTDCAANCQHCKLPRMRPRLCAPTATAPAFGCF